ncbi:outer membrane lipoprotein-sorting protein [Halalkalibaculum sp. DA3122]|uniref:outer membrane lipoprotein-sorting protein n=1 Tax=Halalkalibaculum sp. DA3122 TaxID=3373607 RepID=UPI003754FB09
MNMCTPKKIASSLLLSLTLALPALAQDATEIVRQADLKMRGESSRAEITMKIIRPNWERSLTIKSWNKGDEYSLMLVTAPARDEGTAYLKRGNEIWNWLPNINRTIKLPPSMMSQSWMGSDFSNNDLVRESSIVTDYSHEIVGDTTISGYDCYNIEMIPKPEAPVVWGKVNVFISKEEYLQLRTEFYDEDNTLMRTMTGSKVEELDGRFIPTYMEMEPTDEPGNKTVLMYNEIEFDIDISESFFSIQNMKRVE